MNHVLHALRREWGWAGVTFADVLAVSPMGHLLIVDEQGAIHYIAPEMRQILRLGSDIQAAEFMADGEVAAVWRAEALVTAARQRLGDTAEGEVYTLAANALLAGDYAPENLVRMPLSELISFAGQVAYQTRDLPDGTPIQIEVTD